jgi:hypothetical protein
MLGAKAQPVASAQECAERSDLLIIATPWSEFRSLPLAALRRPGRPLPVVDCWRLLPVHEFAHIVDLVHPGRHRPLQPFAGRSGAWALEGSGS